MGQPDNRWPWQAFGNKTKLAVFLSLHKVSLRLEIPLIWSFFAKQSPETHPFQASLSLTWYMF
jgi:hypothetical protein